MTDDELKKINQMIEDWKISNPDWEDMDRIQNNLKLFKFRTKKPKNRKAAFTTLKLHFKTTATMAEYSEDEDEKELIKEGYLKSDGSSWESPFTVRRKTTEIDPILDKIIKHRLNFANMLDIYSNIFDEDWSIRLKQLSIIESNFINQKDNLFRFHSGY